MEGTLEGGVQGACLMSIFTHVYIQSIPFRAFQRAHAAWFRTDGAAELLPMPGKFYGHLAVVVHGRLL